jgi:hypothetical protein
VFDAEGFPKLIEEFSGWRGHFPILIVGCRRPCYSNHECLGRGRADSVIVLFFDCLSRRIRQIAPPNRASQLGD